MNKIKEYWEKTNRKHLVKFCKCCNAVITNRMANAIYCKKCYRIVETVRDRTTLLLRNMRNKYPNYIIKIEKSSAIIKKKSEKL